MPVVSLALLSILAGGSPSLKIIHLPGDARQVSVIAELSVKQMDAIPEGVVERQVGRDILTLVVVENEDTPSAAMLGDYRRKGAQLTFFPRFRLSADLTYRASFIADNGTAITMTHRIQPVMSRDRAVVTGVYPSADALPANSLKFYIHFSQPMREGRAIFERIHLLDERGQRVYDPWRRTELWSEDARRFTLWIHPGRVKQGVNLREDFGPVLYPDRKYTLLIEQRVQAQDGQLLQKGYQKIFRTLPDDRVQPLPQKWKLSIPAVGTRKPLRLGFGEPLDHALAQRCISIRYESGQQVDCSVSLVDDDSGALLTPANVWKDAQCYVVIDSILEDLAGNTPMRVFDTDLTESPGPKPQLEIPFRPSTTANGSVLRNTTERPAGAIIPQSP